MKYTIVTAIHPEGPPVYLIEDEKNTIAQSLNEKEATHFAASLNACQFFPDPDLLEPLMGSLENYLKSEIRKCQINAEPLLKLYQAFLALKKGKSKVPNELASSTPEGNISPP